MFASPHSHARSRVLEIVIVLALAAAAGAWWLGGWMTKRSLSSDRLEITQQQAVLRDRDNHLARRETELARREAKIGTREAAFGHKEETLLQSVQEKKDADLALLEEEQRVRRAALEEEFTARRDELESRIAAEQVELDTLRAQIEAAQEAVANERELIRSALDEASGGQGEALGQALRELADLKEKLAAMSSQLDAARRRTSSLEQEADRAEALQQQFDTCSETLRLEREKHKLIQQSFVVLAYPEIVWNQMTPDQRNLLVTLCRDLEVVHHRGRKAAYRYDNHDGAAEKDRIMNETLDRAVDDLGFNDEWIQRLRKVTDDKVADTFLYRLKNGVRLEAVMAAGIDDERFK